VESLKLHPLPDPVREQETFWIWFHPCFQISDDVSELNDLYKILHDEDFMFQLTKEEWESLMSQIVISKQGPTPSNYYKRHA